MNKDLEKIIKEIECYQNEDMCLIMLSQKENKALLDYITNLQQENERLKYQLKVQEDLTIKNRMRKHIYKSRCEKAVEKSQELKDSIDKSNFDGMTKTILILGINQIQNILQNGSDNNEFMD